MSANLQNSMIPNNTFRGITEKMQETKPCDLDTNGGSIGWDFNYGIYDIQLELYEDVEFVNDSSKNIKGNPKVEFSQEQLQELEEIAYERLEKERKKERLEEAYQMFKSREHEEMISCENHYLNRQRR